MIGIHFSATDQNRGAKTDSQRSANRYLKRILYHAPYLPKLETNQPWPNHPITGFSRWFSIMTTFIKLIEPVPFWKDRPDPFLLMAPTTFEVGTYLDIMFHHIPDDLSGMTD